MNLENIQSNLQRLFYVEETRIVFWYDGEQSFEESLPELGLFGDKNTSPLSEVKLLRLDESGDLETKILLEHTDTTSKYLLYAPFDEPNPEENWLLDIRLYSRRFRADQIEIQLKELGLEQEIVRNWLRKRESFLKNKDRFSKFKKLVAPSDGELELDLKMMVVVSHAPQNTFFSVLSQIFLQVSGEEESDLDYLPSKYKKLEKYGISDIFWNHIQEQFAYQEEKPTLHKLLLSLFATDFYLTMSSDIEPETFPDIEHFIKTEVRQSGNIQVFLSQWKDQLKMAECYEKIARSISNELSIEEKLRTMDESTLLHCFTFEEVEKRVLSILRDQLNDCHTPDPSHIGTIITLRKDGYWSNHLFANHKDSVQFLYYKMYQALQSAAELFFLTEKYAEGFSVNSALELYQKYEQELFLMDRWYRKFHEYEREVASKSGDLLKILKEKVENTYLNGFIAPLAKAWEKVVATDCEVDGKLSNWKLDDIKSQQNFYQNYIGSRESSESKIYVIISDAFRYEAAVELSDELKKVNRFQVSMESQLGVLPSYTGLGMAALLPHQEISLGTQSSTQWLVDGKSSASTEDRKKILETVNGTVIQAEDLMKMKRQEARELIKSHQVIYIYHNQIDKKGDHAATENETFASVKQAIQELLDLSKKIINTLLAGKILITADHGFLFQESKLEETDRSLVKFKPENPILSKKRFILSENLYPASGVWYGNTADSAGTINSIDFHIPRGTNRFHFTGGSRFVHGGAMLQEVMIPVISIKQLRGAASEKAKSSKVDIQLVGLNHRVITNRHRFEFIQVEAISERVQPRTLLIGIHNEKEAISNEKMVTFDSSSVSHEDRLKKVSLHLPSNCPTNQKYFLIMRDLESNLEYARTPIRIDINIVDDF